MGNLLAVQIGPVQGFISAARKTRDLWAGSFLLSYLAAAMHAEIDKLSGRGLRTVFPNVPKEGSIYDFFRENVTLSAKNLIPSLPNKLLIYLDENTDVSSVAKSLESAARSVLSDISECVLDDFKGCVDEEKFRGQVGAFLEFYWATVPCSESDFGTAYEHVNRVITAVKNTRLFSQPAENTSWKYGIDRNRDVLDGTNETVILDHSRLAVLSGDVSGRSEHMGAMTFIKRYFVKSYLLKKFVGRNLRKEDVPFADTYQIADSSPYYCIMAFDGDEMGKWLSGEKRASTGGVDSRYVGAFSSELSKFTNEVFMFFKGGESNVAGSAGSLIYAGGDDVLAFLPVSDVLSYARQLHDKFAEHGLEGIHFGSSCGISIGHKKSPMRDLKRAADRAEAAAKNKYGRNALGISVCKRSGEIIEWGVPFEFSEVMNFFTLLSKALHNGVSARLPYDMLRMIESYEAFCSLEFSDSDFIANICGILRSDFDAVMDGKQIPSDKRSELADAFKEMLDELAACGRDFCAGTKLAGYVADLFRVVAWIDKK